MNRTTLKFSIQGSEMLPYTVTFSKSGSKISANCTCRAGEMGLMCKHRFSILNGDESSLLNPNFEALNEVKNWIEESSISTLIEDIVRLENEKKSIDKILKATKKQVAKILNQ